MLSPQAEPDRRGPFLVGALALSLQFDAALRFGRLTVYHNELVLAAAAVLAAVWLGPRLREALPWGLAFAPLVAWVLVHAPAFGVWPCLRADLRFAQFFLALALPPLLLRGRSAVRDAVRAVLWIGMAASAWALAQCLLPGSAWLNAGHAGDVVYGIMPARAGMGHHNQWGAYLCAWLMVACACLLVGLERRLAAAALALGLAALVASYSRGAWIGAGLACAFLAGNLSRPLRWGLLVLALGVGGIVVRGPLVPPPGSPLGPDGKPVLLGEGPALWNRVAGLASPGARGPFYRALGREFLAAPDWGRGDAGLKALLARITPGLPVAPSERKALSSHAHSLYFQLGLAWGWPGVLAWFLALAPLGWALTRGWTSGAGKSRIWAAALSGAVAAFLLQSATDFLLVHARGAAVALCWGVLWAGLRAWSGPDPAP